MGKKKLKAVCIVRGTKSLAPHDPRGLVQAADDIAHDLKTDPAASTLYRWGTLPGVGNLYKAEVLFLRGVNPWQPVGQVANLGAVAELARRLLDANKERIGQVTTGNWHRGEETWVYGRRGRPCRRCGTPIRSEGQQDRITFWCPSCQPD